MRRCLVSGGAGFIGSHLVEALVGMGHEVRVLDDFSTGSRANLAAVEKKVEVIAGSITDPSTVARAVANVEWLFHLAALPSVQRSVEAPLPTHEICATGTLLLLDGARKAGVRRVVYAASSSAYGDCPGTIRKEVEPVSPMSPYAVAKLTGEYYCRCFTRVYGLETASLRFFNIFGPRQNPDSPYSGVIPIFISAMSAGKSPQVHGDGLQSRDFTYVDNAVQAVIKAASAKAAVGKVYNIGNGGNTSLLDLIRLLNELLAVKIQPTHVEPRMGDVRFSQADISLARADLGYDPQISLKEGLRRTIDAIRARS
jgi:UDP-glucose 4-epimerase